MKTFAFISVMAATLVLGGVANAQTFSVTPKNSPAGLVLTGSIDFKQTLPRATCTLANIPYSFNNNVSSNDGQTTASVGQSLCTGFLSLVKMNQNWVITATSATKVNIAGVFVNTIGTNSCGSASTSLTGTVGGTAPSTYIDIDPAVIPGVGGACTIYGGRVYPSGGIAIATP